jgi:hypothetical protein
VDLLVWGGVLVIALGLGRVAATRHTRRRRQLVDASIGEPQLRRRAIEQLSQEQVTIRLRRVRQNLQDIDHGASREESELLVCIAELLVADDRSADAAAELGRIKVGLSGEGANRRARIEPELAARLALERGDAERALAFLDGRDGPRLGLLRARALAALDHATDEVWRLLSAEPHAVLAEYSERHPNEAAARITRRILDGEGVYR